MSTYPPLIPGQTFTYYGQSITWSPLHYTPSQLHPLLYTHDTQADQVLSRLDTLYPPPHDNKKPRDYLPLLLQSLTLQPPDPFLSSFWTHLITLPPFISPPQILRAQKIFYRHLGPIITGLTFQSLLGGLSSPQISTTLSQTNGFSPLTARRRLLQTFTHLLNITSSPDSLFNPKGIGFLSTIRVRLLHASVRRRLLSSLPPESQSPIPLNDLHSLATTLSFSISLTDLSLPRQGIFLSSQEKTDWLQLWKYISHLLGISHPCLNSPVEARAMLESIVVAQIPLTMPFSSTSRRLANNMIYSLTNKPPTFATRNFLRAQARWLNGDEISDGLGIENPGVYYKLLVGTQCCLFVVGHMLWKLMCILPYNTGERWDQMVVEGSKKVVTRRIKEMMMMGRQGVEGEYVTDWWGFTESMDNTGKKKREKRLSVEHKLLVMMVFMIGTVGWMSWILLLGLRRLC
ncbi:hypothetical protein QBC38DRAFT_475429 [Podospora fimiseda]|uniref:ER-bound oxygenase mpaB/mpaB'/Rubber oxygenase catalytic domain-containing protein n=1 Tax=Podospora fimiseda TaxID=252190 RepID=A0AAN7H131_9PEZI|nr:hypothetical protein QBC38DRAFT_475429 [Podospora fimiseda]